jgi:ferredoxin-type protein NapH
MNRGKILLSFSVFTRLSVITVLCLIALWTEYINLKSGYNLPRLVELSQGKAWRIFYEYSDSFFSLFGDPLEWAQTNGGMTWSIRLLGIPFTDPIAMLSLLVKNHTVSLSIVIGLVLPLSIVLVFGRVFCSYFCPASLVFFFTARIRNMLKQYFYLPELKLPKSFAWGILIGGLSLSYFYGHGIWALVLPYFSMGHTIFNSLAFGPLPIMVYSLVFFFAVDFFLGHQFTCRYLCPTGRLLGFLGSKSLVRINRDKNECITGCTSCNDVCPFEVKPNQDLKIDCSLCGECMVICPTKCLSVGFQKKEPLS